jgi:hypothetical protein
VKYLLLIYGREQDWTEAERAACYDESARLARDLKAEGKYVAASPLQPVSTAASVRVRDNKPLITDGPFAETREQLGGYFLIDAADRDEALAVAARLPAARFGTVEVRPLLDIDGLPEGTGGLDQAR